MDLKEGTMNTQTIVAAIVIAALLTATVGLKAYVLWQGERQ